MTKEQIQAKIQAKRERLDAIKALSDEEYTDEVRQERISIVDEIKKLDKDLKLIEEEAALYDSLDQVVEPKPKSQHKETEFKDNAKIETGKDLEAEKPFNSLGEQLRAIYLAGADRSQPVDKRLLGLNEKQGGVQNAASGMGESVPSEGGFALQQDFAGMIFDSAIDTGAILSRCDTYEIGPQFNGAKWVDLDESDISTTVFGGVQVYWADEADTVSESHPKLKQREMTLKKLFGIAYATDELLQDTTFITNLYSRAFSTAIERTLEGDIINGNGAGRPLGILQGGALVGVSKESGQPADTVKYKNFISMWARRWLVDSSNLLWVVHPDVEEQMLLMEFPVGTGGVPVYLPPGGASESPYSKLFGRTVIPSDHCSTLGDKGDVLLMNPKEYVLMKKGNAKQDTSIHVRFLYGEQTFRFTFRANGQPKRNSALTIKNSTKTRSPFVTLNART